MRHVQDNGLKLSNSWKGYHIVLNPEYSQQILWRFVRNMSQFQLLVIPEAAGDSI